MNNENKNTKVAHILNDICFSGAETMLNDAGPLFQNGGIDLYAISTGSEVGDYASILEKSGYKIKHIKFDNSFNFLLKLYTYLKSEKIDIVHIHTERAFFWYTLVAKLSQTRVVVRTVHNVFTYNSFYLRNIRRFQRLVSRKLFGLKFISIGNSVEEVERTIFKNKTSLIPNWVNQRKFYPTVRKNEKYDIRSKLKLDQKSIIIVSVGACISTKNHSDILRAMMFIDNSIKENLVYLHVGDGHLCNEEQELAEKLGVDKNTIFFGKTDQVRELLVASDIFVMSSHYEGLPIALLEAMSCGIPGIAYNVPGVKDLIEDGKNGMLVQSTPQDLAHAINKVVKDESLKQATGRNARLFIEKNYNMKNSVTQMMQLYGTEA